MSQASIQEAATPFLISLPTNILTIQDVVLDSPVWRANVLHLEDQIDQFEKWINDFIRALKNYIEAIHKYNTQATTLCKKTFFHNLDGTLIDTKIAGNVVTKFATTLTATIAYRMKMSSDFEDQLLKPLQNMIKNDLKSFKDCRKQFDKMLDKYETQLYRYSVLSKQKEASALREDAFQMYELRKSYVKTSGDYFSRLVCFKANLENILVECFSSALGSHIEEIDESAYACNRVRSKLPGWQQWLDESKVTCDYQINKIKKRCIELQDVYIDQTKPHRSLKRYSTTYNDQMSAVISSTGLHDSDEEPRASSPFLDPNAIGVNNSSSNTNKVDHKSGKQGYLNSRIVITSSKSRPSWTRRWFFLQEGWFGTCIVTTINKEKGCITLGDRVRITDCVFRVNTDIDRRYCFEVIHPKCSYYVQAETEEEMQQWLWTIEYNMEKHEQIHKPLPVSPPQARFLSPTARKSLSASQQPSSPNLVAMSSSPLPSPDGSPIDDDSRPLTPIVSTTTSSLTALLIKEGEHNTTSSSPTATANMMSPTAANQQQHNDNNSSSFSQQLSAWGMPWLTTGINALSHTNSEEDLPSSAASISGGDKLRSSNSSIMSGAATATTATATTATATTATATTATAQQQVVVWPTKLEMDVPKPELSHYTTELETSQRVLRKLFANVPEDEVVIQSFLASYYKKPSNDDEDMTSFGYSGTAYVTQKSLSFYSCTLMTCVNMLVVPLEKIKSIRLDNTDYSNGGTMMLIEVETRQSEQSLSFGLWLASADLISERLKVVVENAKQKQQTAMDLQTLYDTIRNITPNHVKKMKATPTSHVTTSSAALYASVTPLTVQAQQQQPIQQTLSTSTTGGLDDEKNEGGDTTTAVPTSTGTKDNKEEEEGEGGGEKTESRSVTPPSVHRGSPAQGALTAVYNNAVAAKKKKNKLSISKPTASTGSTAAVTPDEKPSTPVPPKEEGEVWPNDIPKPKGEVSCDCADHLEKKEADLVLPVSAKQLYQLMFSDEQTGIWFKLNKAKNNGEPSISEWKKSDTDGVQLERTVNYIMPVNQPIIKAKETDVVETQQLLQKEDHLCYVVMVISRTPNMPYADAFIPCIKYCITYISPTSCRLVCSIGVKWLKSIFVKGMVNKAATNGMIETVTTLVPIIRQEVSSITNNMQPSRKQKQPSLARKDSIVPAVPPKDDELLAKEQQKHKTKWLNNNLYSFLFALICILYMVYQFYRLRKYESDIMHHEFNTSITWRGVYLRDLETEVTEKEAALDHINPTVYQFFQDSRTNGTMQQWEYQWFSKHHRIMAEEFGYSRERVGVIRYELLSAFRILNKVEYQLLENEYWNWLSDNKLKCKKSAKSSKKKSGASNKEMCKAIEMEEIS